MGSVYQDGDDTDLAGQGSFDLHSDEVARIIQAPSPVSVGDSEPPAANQRQQHVTRSNRRGDHLDEVVAQFNGVDILEDLTSAEVAGEPVIQPASRVGSVFAAVAHEDPARSTSGGFSHDHGPRGFPYPVPLH